MDVLRAQGQPRELVAVGAGEGQRRVLVLDLVMAVPPRVNATDKNRPTSLAESARSLLRVVGGAVAEGQLLLSVGRVIHGVGVEGPVKRRGAERSDELLEEGVPDTFERGAVDGVPEE
jgi:hypothetical protein